MANPNPTSSRRPPAVKLPPGTSIDLASSQAEHRNKRVLVMFTEGEYTALTREANRRNIALATYVYKLTIAAQEVVK